MLPKLPTLVEIPGLWRLQKLEMKHLTLWFSHEKLLAFELDGRKIVKHSPFLPDSHKDHIDGGNPSAKHNRLDDHEFMLLWLQMCDRAMERGENLLV